MKRDKMSYKPEPINTTGINIDEPLLNLIEKLAENNHAVWAKKRIDDGWSYAPFRDDREKTTPCLVNYAALPEHEKEYDRKTTLEILKTLISLGYSIKRSPESILEQSELAFDDIERLIRCAKPMRLLECFSIWKSRHVELWGAHPELFLWLGNLVLEHGEALQAYDIFSHGLTAIDAHQRLDLNRDIVDKISLQLAQSQALALAQCGASENANALLLNIIAQKGESPETLGLLARTYKDMAFREIDPQKKTSLLNHALEKYHQAYQLALKQDDTNGAIYAGINGATLAFLLNEIEISTILAAHVKILCRERGDSSDFTPQPLSYWRPATLAEAELLLGNYSEAKRWYAKAAALAGDNLRSLSSMSRQAKIILTAQKQQVDMFDSIFQIPGVVAFWGEVGVFSGDTALPDRLENSLRSQVRGQLDGCRGQISYSGLSSLADVIFLEEMLKRGGEVNIILTSDLRSIEALSSQLPEGLYARIEKIVSKATTVVELARPSAGSLYEEEFTKLYILGTARKHVEIIDTKMLTLSLPQNNPGGPRCDHEIPVTAWGIGSPPVLNQTIPSSRRDKDQWQSIEGTVHHLFLPMLFADLKGYSRLSEEEQVNFSTSFLEKISQVIKRYQTRLVSKRTMGDGLFLAFQDLKDAVDLARELQFLIRNVDWRKHGLPANLEMRISLDAGPCYSYKDPIMDKMEFCGNYVVRAARMEPITPPGHIFASDTFMALCTALNVKDVNFDYAGRVNLAKDYGTVQAYLVR